VLRRSGDEFCCGPTQELATRVRENAPAFFIYFMRDVRAIVQCHIDLDWLVVTERNGTTSGRSRRNEDGSRRERAISDQRDRRRH
jgi:hypothetical protein